MADGFLIITSQKTNTEVKIPVMLQISEIFKKYNDQLPVISDQNYNDYLKEVMAKAIPLSRIEITENRGYAVKKKQYKHEVLSSHHAIKTFVTLMAQAGVPITSIAVIVGKKVVTLLNHYLGEDQEQAQKDFVKYFPTLMMVS
jgi:hypothetical protein